MSKTECLKSLEIIIEQGVVSYFTRSEYHYSQNEEAKLLALSFAKRFKAFEPILEKASSGTEPLIDLNQVLPFVKFCNDNDINLMKKSKLIRDYIRSKTSSSDLSELAREFLRWNSSSLEIKLAMLTFERNFKWEVLCRNVIDLCLKSNYYYLSDNYKMALIQWAKRKRKDFEKFISLDVYSSYTYDIRSQLSYVNCKMGFVDAKQARRYRSECQAVSMSAIKGLIDGRDNYDKLNFAKLISQFADSKHWEVVRHMQDNLPIENLNVLFANELSSKNHLQNRITEFNDNNKKEE